MTQFNFKRVGTAWLSFEFTSFRTMLHRGSRKNSLKVVVGDGT